ncbi:MAG: hypothetical protein ACR2HN_03745 [Tepidiformaceae bacterium]
MGLPSDRIVDTGYAANMLDEDGRLRRPPLAPGKVTVPGHVRIDGERLFYRWDWTPPGNYASPDEALAARRWATLGEADGLLMAFMKIRSNRQVVAFARRYGPLGLCERGLILGDLFDASREFLDHDHRGCYSDHVGGPGGPWSEPLSIWFRLGDRVRAMFELAARLHTGQGQPEPSLIARAFHRGGWMQAATVDPTPEQSLAFYASELAEQVNLWLRAWRATPQLRWDYPAAPVLRVGTGARQHLALQLATAVGRGGGEWAVCDGCSQPYRRQQRAVQRGRRNWCPGCRADGTMARLIKQAQRKKGRKA